MLTRRALFQATAAAGITAAVGPETTKPHAALFAWARAPGKSTAFTFADLLRAEATLKAANVPRFSEHFGISGTLAAEALSTACFQPKRSPSE